MRGVGTGDLADSENRRRQHTDKDKEHGEMRRNLTILGVAVTAMLAFAAMSAASASASYPGFVAAEGALPFTFTAAGKEGKLETVGGSTVTCNSSTGSGRIENSAVGYYVQSTTIIFKECTASFATTCTTSGAKNAGEIITKTLKGQLEYPRVRTGETGVLLLLNPEARTNTEWIFATFTCGGIVPVTVRTNANTEQGGALGVLEPINTSTHEFTLSFKQRRNAGGEIEQGIQEFTAYKNGANCAEEIPAYLEAKQGADAYTQSAIEDLADASKITLGTGQKGEIQANSC